MQVIIKTSTEYRKISLIRLFAVMLVAAVAIMTHSSITMAADLGLIEANALKGNSTKLVILDSRPRSDWEAGHIPGALHFYWESYTRTDAKGVKYSSFSPQELAVALAGLGIDEKSPIVVYGDADKSWGSEGYTVWLLTWLGHKGPVRLLNGGIQSWRAQNFSLANGSEKPAVRKAGYKVELRPQFIVSTEDIQNNKGAYTLVDTRSTLEWIMGKIPGAIHIPWEDFYTGKDRRPLSSAELKKLLAKHGVDTSRPVVYYCLGGVRSAYAWFAHQQSGLPEARNYKESWAAWEKRAGQ